MILEIEFEATRSSDGQLEVDIQDMKLVRTSLPYPGVQLDPQVQEPIERAIERIAKLLPKDWNI